MTGPHAVCRVTDLFVSQCLHCQGGVIFLFGDTRCGACSGVLHRGHDAWQEPARDGGNIICLVCHEERSASE